MLRLLTKGLYICLALIKVSSTTTEGHMAHEPCTICGFELINMFDACPACDAAEAIIHAGYAHSNYHELLAEKIGDMLTEQDWKSVTNLSKLFPRFA